MTETTQITIDTPRLSSPNYGKDGKHKVEVYYFTDGIVDEEPIITSLTLSEMIELKRSSLSQHGQFVRFITHDHKNEYLPLMQS